MGIKILYHDKCFDGFTAAWAAWKRFGDTAEYIPVSYGQAPYANTTDQDDVYLLDFCYPAHVLRTLSASRLIILDHHKTAEADLELMKFNEHDEVIFDMERSGAGIAWDYFFMEPRPKLIDYIEDHDLWRYALPDSRSIRAYIHSMPYTWHAWDILEAQLQRPERFMDCVDRGESIQDFMDQQIKMICDQAELQLVGGIMVPVVNATSLWSEVGEELNLRYPEARFSAYWHILADGSKKWGLRTKHQNFDVSEVAQAFGGGGHRGAAGWVAPNGD